MLKRKKFSRCINTNNLTVKYAIHRINRRHCPDNIRKLFGDVLKASCKQRNLIPFFMDLKPEAIKFVLKYRWRANTLKRVCHCPFFKREHHLKWNAYSKRNILKPSKPPFL